MNRITQCAAALAAALVLSSGLTATAGAKPPAVEAQTAIQSHTVTLQEFGERDERRVATAEFGMARAWLGEAQSYVDNRRKREELGWALDRLDAVMPLIDALILRAQAEAVANAASERADAKEAEVRRVEDDLDEKRKRRDMLDKEVST